MHTNQKMAQSMAKTTTTMSKINKQMDVKKMAKTMQNFEKENMKMEMTEEMMNDAMGKFQNQSQTRSDYREYQIRLYHLVIH